MKFQIQLLFLSSKYQSGQVTRHWSPDNPYGYCTFPECLTSLQVETTEHILLDCPTYLQTRLRMFSLCFGLPSPTTNSIVTSIIKNSKKSPSKLIQLLLDCAVVPEVIVAAQQYGVYIVSDLYYIGRNWCFSIHRERMKRLCKWNFQ